MLQSDWCFLSTIRSLFHKMLKRWEMLIRERCNDDAAAAAAWNNEQNWFLYNSKPNNNNVMNCRVSIFWLLSKAAIYLFVYCRSICCLSAADGADNRHFHFFVTSRCFLFKCFFIFHFYEFSFLCVSFDYNSLSFVIHSFIHPEWWSIFYLHPWNYNVSYIARHGLMRGVPYCQRLL